MEHSISIKTVNGVLSVADFKAQRAAKADVVGVVLQTETIGMIISLNQWEEVWCIEGTAKEFNKPHGESGALQTLSGLELTRNIVKQNEEDGEDVVAAMQCWEYNRGGLQWYLPCLYELGTIIAYRDKLNKVFEMLGADIINDGGYGWSSSEFSRDYAFCVRLGDGTIFYNDKDDICVVRAVSAFSPLE